MTREETSPATARNDLDGDDVIVMLAERVRMAGKIKPVAEEFGVSIAYISDVLNRNRAPAPAILDGLGLEAVTTYRRKALAPPLSPEPPR